MTPRRSAADGPMAAATESTMVGPTPSTSASSAGVAARIASSEPKWSARARAATGPTWRMLRETRMRQSGLDFASSRFAMSS